MRGFNQALLLGRRLFPQDRDKIDPHILERQNSTLPQTGLSGSERRRNVRNAFRLQQPAKIRNKSILLVDDVFTTGATVNECARILVKNKAADIEVFTFARAVHGP
jgi:ComF family protein